ncbi:MAG: hypothetical protein MJE68_31790 [Proteobacteria bacterium]|nr:hypothetical protein [Pseudomonadota bacterium]
MQPISTIGKCWLNCLGVGIHLRLWLGGIALVLMAISSQAHAQTSPTIPVVNISMANTTLIEPTRAVITLTADPAPMRDLRVELYILPANRTYDISPHSVVNTIAPARPKAIAYIIPAGMAAVNYTIATADRDGINNEFEMRVMPGGGYQRGKHSRLHYTVIDAPRPVVDVVASHSSVIEGEDIEFVFSLATPAKTNVTIEAFQFSFDGYAALSEEIITVVIQEGESETRLIMPTSDDSEKGNSYQMMILVSDTDKQAVVNQHIWVSTMVFDNDENHTLGISHLPQVQEGEDAVFAVRLVPPATTTVSVDYTTQDDSAKAGFDYFPTQGTLTFAPGESQKYVRVTTIDDDLVENYRETLTLQFSNPQGAELSLQQKDDYCLNCEAVVFDNDKRVLAVTTSTPRVSDNDNMYFQFNLTHAFSYNSLINYYFMKYVDDELVAYIPRDQFLAKGSHSVDIRHIANRDGARNKTSRVRFVMHPVTEQSFFLDPDFATASIDVVAEEDTSISTPEALPVVTLSTNATAINNTWVVDEPDPISVTLTASPPPADDLEVSIKIHEFIGERRVEDRSTHAFTIRAGQSNTSFHRGTEDRNSDYDDRFIFTLLPSRNGDYRLSSQPPLEVLVNDSENFTYLVTIETVEDYVTEGSNASYVLRVTPPPSQDLIINYGYYINYITSPQSYSYGGQAIILAGGHNTTFSVFAPDDNLTAAENQLEAYLEVFVETGDRYKSNDLGRNAYTMVVDGSQGASFIEKDLAYTTEGDTLNVSVFLSQPLNITATVDYATKDGKGKAGVDYIAQRGALTFLPGETEQTIAIQTIDNDIVDFDRSLRLEFSNPKGAKINYTHSNHHDIIDDDEAVVTIRTMANDPKSDEIKFQVTTSHAFKKPQHVHYYVIGDDSIQPVDVREFNLPANTTSQNFTLTKGDGNHEMPRNRTYTLYLRADGRYSLGTPNTADFTTKGVPAISVVAEASTISEARAAVFYLLADPPPKRGLGIRTLLATPDALNNPPVFNEYFIPAGVGRQKIQTRTYREGSEDVRLVMEVLPTTQLTYVLGSQPRAEILVEDIDAHIVPLTLTADKTRVVEGDNITFTLRIPQALAEDINIDYLHEMPNARVSHFGYGDLVIPAGETTITKTIAIKDDNYISPNIRSRFFRFVAGTPHMYPRKRVEVYVIDNDGGAKFSLDNVHPILEGSSQNISVHLSQPLEESASVHYATQDLSAVAGVDYEATSGNLTFAPGEVEKSFLLTTIDNDEVDGRKVFQISLRDAVGANVSVSQEGFDIIDDDETAAYLQALPRQHQSDNHSFRLVLTKPVAEDIEIGYFVRRSGELQAVLDETITIPAATLTTNITIPAAILTSNITIPAAILTSNITIPSLSLTAASNYTLAIAESSDYTLATPSHLPLVTTPLPTASLVADMVLADNATNATTATTATAHFTIRLDPPADRDLVIGIDFAGDSLNNTDADLPHLIGMGRGQTEAEFSMLMTPSENITTLLAELLPGEGYWLGNATVSLQLAAVQVTLPEEGEKEEEEEKDEVNWLERANRIMLPKTALVFADSVAGAIRGRITSAFDNWGRATPTSVQVEGQTVRQFAERQAQQQAARNPWDAPSTQQATPIDPTQLNFATAIDTGTDSGSGGAGLWGQGFRRSLAVNAGDFTSDGDVRGGVLGVDLVADDGLILGLGVGVSSTNFAFGDATQADKQGSHTSDATTLHPYFGWQNGAGIRLWGNAGFGEGDVVAVMRDTGDPSNPPQTQNYTSVFDMRSLGLGGSVAIGDQSRRGDGDGDTGAMQFNLIGEGVVTETKDATWADWVRHGLLRLGIEWRHTTTDTHGNTDTSGLQIAARHDFAGHANNANAGTVGNGGENNEDSTGVEVIGDLEKHLPDLGLTLDLQARVFVTDDSNYDEWGVAGGVSWSDPTANPDKQNHHPQGLSLAIRPQWGDTTSQSDTLLQHGSNSISQFEHNDARYEYDVRYGVPILGGKHGLTHFARGDDQDQPTIGSEVTIGRLRAVLEQEARGNHAFIRYQKTF